jgi:IPT/TIG domain
MTSRYSLFAILYCLIGLFNGCKENDSVSVSNFDPIIGDIGTEVTINGSNFSTTNCQVFFGTAEAKVNSSTPSLIRAVVPKDAITGKIKVVCNGKQTVTASDFTVTSGTWKTKGSFQRIGRLFPVMFTINNKVYVHYPKNNLGDASFWEYDLASGGSSQKKEIALNFSSSFAVAWSTPTKGYVFLGYDFWEYDPALNTWTKKMTPATFSSLPSLAFFDTKRNSGIIFAYDKSAWIYSHVDDTWGLLPVLPFSPDQSQLALTNGFAFVIPPAQQGSSKAEFWKFDPAFFTWSKAIDYPDQYVNFMFSANDEIYAGYTYSDMWKFNNSSNTWVQKASPPSPARYSPISFSLNQKGYLGLGVSSVNDALLYDILEYSPN